MSLPHGIRLSVLAAFALGFLCLSGTTVSLAQENKASEEAMAAYADAANFQTGGALDLAIEGWQKFLTKYPKHTMAPEAAHYLGVCYMQQEKPDYLAASRAFERALKDKDYELREESLANHGWCLYASAGEGENRDTDKLNRALATFETLRKENPKSEFLDRALFFSGEAAYGLGEAEQAIKFYDQLLSAPNAKESPLRCDALYARGVAQEELDEIQDALASYQQLLSGCDRGELVTDVRLRVGDLEIMRQRYDKAIESFAAAFESADSDDDRAYAIFRQAFALVQAGKPREAASKYEQLLADYPDSQFAASAILASAQSTYRSGDVDAAAMRFEKVLKRDNRSAATEAAHWLARIQISKGQPTEAIRVCRQQIDRGAEGEYLNDLQLDLAEALSMNPDTIQESMQLFEKIYRDAPDDALASRALYNAAFSALQINKPEKALQLALEFIKRFPDDTLVPDVKFVAAESQLLTGNTRHAADTYKSLIRTTAKDNFQRPLWLLRTAAACNAAGQYDETTKILGAELGTLTEPEQKAEASLLIGEAQSKSGDADSAAKTWGELISAHPKSPTADQARYRLARQSSEEGDYEQAIDRYDEILSGKQVPSLIPYAQYGKGWALMQSKQYEPALRLLDQMLKENKQHPLRNDATLARGIALRNVGKLDLAQQDLETFLAIPPTGEQLGHALYESALIDQQRKQPNKAAAKLEQLVDEVPDYPSMDKVLYELGWSLKESGNEKAAIKHFNTLISKYPKTPLVGEAAYFIGQKHYAAERWKQAAESMELAARSASDRGISEKAYYQLGWSRFLNQEYAAAEKAFIAQAKQHPKGKLAFDATVMIGESRFKRGDYKAALAGYEVARNQVRKNNETAKRIRNAKECQVREVVFLHGGQSASQLKSWDVAIEWYNELRERFPATEYLPEAFYETGFAYQQSGDKQNAFKFYKEVADNYRNEAAARARFMIGELHFSDREFDKAITEFQRVIFGFGAEKASPQIKNWQAKSGFEAGRCSELLMQAAKKADGKRKALDIARGFYNYVVQKHPKHELAEKSRGRLEALKK